MVSLPNEMGCGPSREIAGKKRKKVEDQNKTTPIETPKPVDQELSKDELDDVAGGGDSCPPIVGPHR